MEYAQLSWLPVSRLLRECSRIPTDLRTGKPNFSIIEIFSAIHRSAEGWTRQTTQQPRISVLPPWGEVQIKQKTRISSLTKNNFLLTEAERFWLVTLNFHAWQPIRCGAILNLCHNEYCLPMSKRIWLNVIGGPPMCALLATQNYFVYPKAIWWKWVFVFVY